MSTPQDRKAPRPTVQEMLHNALQLQGANFAQKGQLDMMATKIIMCLKALKEPGLIAHAQNRDGTFSLQGSDEYYDVSQAEVALNEIARILSMTRDETAEARKGFEYPDVRIQAVINEAAQKLFDILLEDGK
jgi:hypothetical protein